ncbi:hypothetical protein MNBD_PLANCTO02-2703 [hydrothermal vent metagenome]|uniref:Uncharacterized protein n=1 Tax=hydrothermal vent metagenome TaxID=652676 RepID=A0A3B1E8S1_9ZZZZ
MNRYLNMMLIVLLFAASEYGAIADETPSKLIKQTVGQQTGNEKSTSDLDRQLLKELSGTNKREESKEKQRLNQLLKRMEQVEQAISQKEMGEKTQQLQQSVVKDLDWLIKLLEQKKTRNMFVERNEGGGTHSKAPPSKQKDENKNTPQAKPKNGGKNKENKATNSEGTMRTANKTNVRTIERKVLEKNVWGHLPATLRKKLLNIYSEKYLPQYDDVVRKYFESLAEEGRKKSFDE